MKRLYIGTLVSVTCMQLGYIDKQGVIESRHENETDYYIRFDRGITKLLSREYITKIDNDDNE